MCRESDVSVSGGVISKFIKCRKVSRKKKCRFKNGEIQAIDENKWNCDVSANKGTCFSDSKLFVGNRCIIL